VVDEVITIWDGVWDVWPGSLRNKRAIVGLEVNINLGLILGYSDYLFPHPRIIMVPVRVLA
jgi:hypothetical protein